MDKTTFLAVLQSIVAGFEDAQFKQKMAAAKQAGDVPQLIALPLGVQQAAFAQHGLDATAGVAAFKEAGRTYGLDPEAAPLLARMKAALG
jgi:hypothetical protein